MKRAEEAGVRCARAYKVGFGRECAGGASGDWVVDLVFGFVFALAREKFGEFWRRRRRRKGGKRGGGVMGGKMGCRFAGPCSKSTVHQPMKSRWTVSTRDGMERTHILSNQRIFFLSDDYPGGKRFHSTWVIYNIIGFCFSSIMCIWYTS
jgi:hypothetical protein